MVGWHHRLEGHELEQAPGLGDGQGRLASDIGLVLECQNSIIRGILKCLGCSLEGLMLKLKFQ